MSNDSSFSAVARRVTAHMNPPVFFGSAFLVIVFVVFGGGFTEIAADFFQTTQESASRWFGWYYVLVVTALLILSIILMLGPSRRVRLGGPDARPEFSRATWFSMLFAAGMGIGLVYFGVAEPVMHYDNPLRVEPQTFEARRESMRITFFHWGLHAWGIYVILALAVAHAHFNRDLPLAPRSVLEPILGDYHKGIVGDAVDILCTVGTLLGVATSLGLGAMQLNASLEVFFGTPESLYVQLLLIAGITLIATISVVTGVKRGLRRLSETNLVLALMLMVFVLFAGPTLYVTELFISSLGNYLQYLPRMSFYLDPGVESEWQVTWTLFYWGWWISWSPFVAIFVARVSYGRTVREFILCVLFVPTLVTFIWLSIFGGSGLWLITKQGETSLIDRVNENISASLQLVLATMPLATVVMILATLIIALFFVTSSDSGSLVDDMVTSGGDPHPPRAQRVFWACSEGAVAATLLVLGGLSAIRNAAISLGLPMSLVVVAAAVALVKTLYRDPMARRGRRSGTA